MAKVKTTPVSVRVLDSAISLLQQIEFIVECTYGHDPNTGERDDSLSDESGADIVERLIAIEPTLGEVLRKLRKYREE